MSLIAHWHERFVFGRRIRVLAQHIASLIPPGASVLDIGCGDGRLASLLLKLRSDISIRGVDPLVRSNAALPVESFDGRSLAYENQSFDVALLIDVLHHTDDPTVVLGEAARVARSRVVLKDHNRDGIGADATLRLMDWVGNARYGVRLPYNYLSAAQWQAVFAACDLSVEHYAAALPLYPFPASLLFQRRLHFIAALRPLAPDGNSASDIGC